MQLREKMPSLSYGMLKPEPQIPQPYSSPNAKRFTTNSTKPKHQGFRASTHCTARTVREANDYQGAWLAGQMAEGDLPRCVLEDINEERVGGTVLASFI